jgi:DNA-binding LacI/PurR family transcriptional regulator
MILDGYGERYSPQTRAKVLQTAKELNYRPSIVGRSLRTRKSFLLGVLFSEANASLLSGFLRGAMTALTGQEVSPVVFTHRDHQEFSEALSRCLHRRVDALIVNVPSEPHEGALLSPLADAIKRGLPVVEIFGHELSGVPSVNIDNEAAARAAVDHLRALGHEHIAMLTHERYLVSAGALSGQHFDAWARFRGYEQAVRNHGLEPVLFTHPLTAEVDTTEDFVRGGEDALNDILGHPQEPSAVICYDDMHAYGLIRAARRRNVTVPGRLSVVGYGDREFSRIIHPPLTTLRAPAFDAGEEAVRMASAPGRKRPAAENLLHSELVVRGSTGPCPSGTA